MKVKSLSRAFPHQRALSGFPFFCGNEHCPNEMEWIVTSYTHIQCLISYMLDVSPLPVESQGIHRDTLLEVQ